MRTGMQLAIKKRGANCELCGAGQVGLLARINQKIIILFFCKENHTPLIHYSSVTFILFYFKN